MTPHTIPLRNYIRPLKYYTLATLQGRYILTASREIRLAKMIQLNFERWAIAAHKHQLSLSTNHL